MKTKSFDALQCLRQRDQLQRVRSAGRAHPDTIAQAITRRDFVKVGVGVALAAAPGLAVLTAWADPSPPVVSIVRIANDNIEAAVEQAIELLGGIAAVTHGKDRILLKPNLVANVTNCTTNPTVVRALARLMQAAGKEVLIGEGSGAVTGFNSFGSTSYLTRCEDVLNGMQQAIFYQLGYTDLAHSLGIPLVNLHTGDLVTVPVPAGLFWKEIVLHRVLTDIDLLVSVPIMKTHACATVTLGLKNVIGLYPGAVYGAPRFWIHNNTASVSPGIAFEILDMVRVNKMGLTVIDAYRAMQGDGPVAGTVIPMNLIIAGTCPLAADMVGAAVMGFTDLESIPTIAWAHKLGMTPANLANIELRGESIDKVRRNFIRPNLGPCTSQAEIYPAPKPSLALTQDGRGVVTWDETIPRPKVELTSDHQAYVAWTNTAAGTPRAILERGDLSQKTNWVRVIPQAPGRYEFDPLQVTNRLFRLRKPRQ